MAELLYQEESYKVRGAVYNVYKEFGSAFKEKVYHRALIRELIDQGLKIENEKRIDIYYKGKKVGIYIPDVVVEEIILIEMKCKPILTRGDIQQFWQYLKGSNYKVGFLVNFGKPGGVEIIRRVYDTARKEIPRLSA
ncbi:MAG: GxxExxY protein [Patescibacteria group bacterium]